MEFETVARHARIDPMRLGNLAVFLLVWEALTGLGLMFHYRPTVDDAWLSLVDLREVSRFGFVRELHRWGAWAAIIAVWLHLLRAGLRRSYTRPGRFNWNVGVVLMVLTLALAATGYLLPWDQQAYWGIAAVSPSAAGAADGPALLAVYVLHCVVLPLLAAALTVYHLRRARRDGSVSRESAPVVGSGPPSPAATRGSR